MRFLSVHVVDPYSSTDTGAACKEFHFISSDRSDFRLIDYLSIAVHAFDRCILTSLSVAETLLPKCMNLYINFRWPPQRVEIAPSRLNHMYTVYFV